MVSMKVVGIDPGTKALGWAIFRNEKLSECGLIRSASLHCMSEQLVKKFAGTSGDLAVIEVPQVYRHSPGDPNDLINVSVISGAALAACAGFDTVELPRPKRWKGSVPKDVHNRRVLAKLSNRERCVLQECGVPKYLLHNVIDAIGLGMWGVDAYRRRAAGNAIEGLSEASNA